MKILFITLVHIIISIPDPYRTLGVSQNATNAEIKKAYKAGLIKSHPDRFDESQKDIMSKKYTSIQEAYDILSNPEYRKAWDEYGERGLDMAKKQRQEREFHQNNQRMNEEAQNIKQDVLQSSPVKKLNMANLYSFYRRNSVTIVLLYRSTDNSIQELSNLITKLNTEFDQIFTIYRIYCDEEEELCAEYSAFNTPKINIFSSSINKAPIDLDISEELRLINVKSNQLTNLIVNEASNLMEDFVTFINSDNIDSFESRPNPKIILFTNKLQTPPLLRQLSKDYKQSVSFGIVKNPSTYLTDMFEIVSLPTILGFPTGKLYIKETYNGSFNINEIKKFIRDMVASQQEAQNRISTFNQHTVFKRGICDKDDRKYCLFIFKDQFTPETLNSFTSKFIQEMPSQPFKIIIISDTFFDKKSLGNNIGLNNDQFNFLVWKGNMKKILGFKFDYLNFTEIRSLLEDILSEMKLMKKLPEQLSSYVQKSVNEEL